MSTLYGPILIVEDVPNVLELLEVTLRFKGYAVLTARTGEEALEVIARQRPVLPEEGIRLRRRREGRTAVGLMPLRADDQVERRRGA